MMHYPYGSREWRTEQKERQDKLNDCLKRLCDREISSYDELLCIAEQLLEVYEDKDFRHRYSDIIDVVYDIDSSVKLSAGKRAQYVEARGIALAQGIRALLTHVCTEECGEESTCPVARLQLDKRLDKLYDHANLEARRAGYMSISAIEAEFEFQEYRKILTAVSDEMDSAANEIARSIEQARNASTAADKASQEAVAATKSAEKARRMANKATKKAKRLQSEMVSVLGVFSAIILAFNASVTFVTSSIAAVDQHTPFNIAFVVSIVGAVLFNCLYGAFAFVHRIIRPEGSPDRLLSNHRVVGIELMLVSICLVLGTLTYSYGSVRWAAYSSFAMFISVVLLSFGVRYFLWTEQDDRK